MMNDGTAFYVFYTWAYGYEHHRKVFNSEEDLLKFIKEAREEGDDTPYRRLIVIRGQEVEFEPATVVEIGA
jgi:hypothetical protein